MESPRTRVSAHGLCVNDDRILLVRLAPPLPDAGQWGLPGGGLDWGETPEEAVVREFREETGLVATIEGIAGTFSRTFASTPSRPDPALHFLSIMYWVQVIDSELVHEADGTTDLAAWIPRAEVDDVPLADLAIHGLRLIRQAARQ